MNPEALAVAEKAVSESTAMTRQWIREGMPREEAITSDWEAAVRLADEAEGAVLHNVASYLAGLLAVATYELAALQERTEGARSWPAFRKAFDVGALFALPEDGSKDRVARVEFVEDPNAATGSALDPGGEAR